MVFHEPCILYTIVTDDDTEIDHSDEDYIASSQSKSDYNNDAEEQDAKYDYAQSRAFLDMGSGSPIDDLVEFGTLRLPDWNDSMTDIQLDMRFVDKVQAISVVQKWSISVGREYRVVKSKSDQ
ncbi:hypothetical protein M9H77_02480 [Catharanthus roseus]|uniref:Uncharacterized protein n=1 Tax=Catharanthus roseus TaxID=4058 RepID=A0ACC0C905_CATRO|nr:hypothetical protein M9H77_02480 [Catharanthus roseus]